MDLTKYARYIGNDPYINRTFPKFMRPENRRISKLLESVDFSKSREFDFYKSNVWPINGNGFLINFLKKHDNAQIYICEAKRKTVLTKKFLNDYLAYCKKNIPNELLNATFDQLYHNGDNDVIVNFVQRTDATEDISPVVRIIMPLYANNVAYANKVVRNFIDFASNNGYILTYNSVSNSSYHDKLPYDVTLYFLTFEAMYSNLNVKLESSLFHVTLEDSLPSIAKNGLLPRAQSSEYKYPPRIYLFNKTDKEKIFKYGEYKAMEHGKKSYYVIRIEKNILQNSDLYKSGKITLFRDPAFSSDENNTDQTALFTDDSIPLQMLNNQIAKFDVGNIEPTIMHLSDFKK